MRRPTLDPELAFWRGRPLGEMDVDWLRGQGVPGLALGFGTRGFAPLLRASVVFGRGRRFDFAHHVADSEISRVTAYTLLAIDEGGAPLDVVAWHPRSSRVATWLGRTGLLGLDYPCAGSPADPLTVFADPLGWLVGERRGVVVVDERLARPELLAVDAIRTDDVSHGVALRAMLQKVRLPSILISAERAAA